jgi:hypothetical protein
MTRVRYNVGSYFWSSETRSRELLRVERDCLNEVSRVCLLGRVLWLPLYRVREQATYKEVSSPARTVVSLREGN